MTWQRKSEALVFSLSSGPVNSGIVPERWWGGAEVVMTHSPLPQNGDPLGSLLPAPSRSPAFVAVSLPSTETFRTQVLGVRST